MIQNKVFPPHTNYSGVDRLFVWMVDEMEMSKWYDGSKYWDLVLQIYEAKCYNSGMYISLDENKRFKKIEEETIGKREFEQFKKHKYEEFINSIGVSNDD